MTCTVNTDCSVDKLCKAGSCVDPCSLRAACGRNALCTVSNHFPRCECPECYTGHPHIGCRVDQRCKAPVPPAPTPPHTAGCATNSDCPGHLYCNAGACATPCGHTSVCQHNEKCVAANHQASCICKTKLVINALGELTCPQQLVGGCGGDSECPAHQACIGRTCQNPCTRFSCEAGKKCAVQAHRPVCLCDKSCSPEVSICLRDKGCPPDQACVNYQCRDPCEGLSCPQGTPCVVQNHVAQCKFCPAGFTPDANYGCIKG